MTHYKGRPPKTETGGIDDLPEWARHEIKKLRRENARYRTESKRDLPTRLRSLADSLESQK